MNAEADPAPELRWPKRVEVVEVGPRDGFQMERALIPTELKVEIIELLATSGAGEIEAVSFVSPRVIPQMRDADEVMRSVLARREGSSPRFSALVPNQRGAERALEAGVDSLHVVVAASETYNRRNVGLSVDQSLTALAAIVGRVDGRMPVAATLAVTFGCPFEGQLADDRLVDLAGRLAETGIDCLGLADTAGLGHPLLIRRVVRKMRRSLPGTPLRLHLHDTRGLGLANAMAALEEGVTIFDTAFGGLGGCPVMAGASGNLPTEDFVHFLNESGIESGVSLDVIREASRRISGFLGRELPSRVLASGTREELMALNREPSLDR